MRQKKKAWNLGILFCLAMVVSMMLSSVSVQADTKGTAYYGQNYRVIDMNNQLVEEIVLHEGETLVFTLGNPLDDGTYEALGDNYFFSGEEWRITTWLHSIEGYGSLNELAVDWCYENDHVKVWEELATNRRIICVKGISATDASDDYNLTHFGGTDFSLPQIIASIPITVLPAEPGVTYPSAGDERPYDLFDSREEAYQYVRKLIGWHINEEITACYPIEDVDDTEVGYDIDKVLGFYTDQIGMNPSGDYLYNSGFGSGTLESGGTVTWRGTEYKEVIVDYGGWIFNTTYEQEQWVEQTIKALWADGGALSYARNASDYDKVLACMNWIGENTSHQLSYESLAHSAYSALSRGYATCEGLACLLDRMLSEVGVSSRILMNEEEGAHTFNIVLLDGKYYYCDPTTGETLKGSANFTTGRLNWKYQNEDFQKFILSRVSVEDYQPGAGGSGSGGGSSEANYTGLASAADGNWYLYTNGAVNSTYTGLYCDANYGWWLVLNGRVAFEYSGLYGDANYGWWLVNGGAVDFSYSGLYGDTNYGWWLVNGGAVDFGYTGLYGDANYGWWLVNGGAVHFGYTGLYGDANCGWWLINGGAVNFGYSGLYGDANYGWWLINGGAINFAYTGLYYDTYCGWWYVEGGAINFGYTGEVYYEGAPYYVINGALV